MGWINEELAAASSANARALISNTASANQFNANQAALNREWQEQQNAKAMAFNASEAQKNRDWQQMMSNTAHQREVNDLVAAGLNPVLSATGGNGASVTSGATASGVTSSGGQASADTSINGAIASVLSSVYNNSIALDAKRIDAQTNLAIADKYTAMDKLIADIQAETSRYGADRNAKATEYMANINKQINSAKLEHDTYMAQNYPSNIFSAIAAILGSVFDDGNGTIAGAADIPAYILGKSDSKKISLIKKLLPQIVAKP